MIPRIYKITNQKYIEKCLFDNCNKSTSHYIYNKRDHIFIDTCLSHSISLLLGGHIYVFGKMWNIGDIYTSIVDEYDANSKVLGHTYNVCA